MGPWGTLLLFVLWGFPALRAETQPAPTWVKDFQKAREDVLGGNWDQAVPVFQRIVREVEGVRLTRPLTSEESRVYQWSLDYLARFYLQQDRPQEARFYYITLLQANPQYEFPDTPPPSVTVFFQQLRQSLIGFLSISVRPPDAVLYLDQRRIGQGALSQQPVLEGTYQLRVERPGYAPWQRIVTIKGGRLTEVEPIELQRVSGALFVATAPQGVEVYLNGRRVGVTQGEAPPGVRAFAETRQWPPEEFSDYLAIPVSDTGEHYLEFRKPCYDTVQLIIRVPPLQDVFIDPVRLEPAVGRIGLQADAEADVYIDGQFQGKASQGTFVACAGRHTVTLKNSWGTFSGDVDVVRGEVVLVPAAVVPRVVFLGWIVDEGVSEGVFRRLWDLVRKSVQRWDRAVWVDATQVDVPWDGQTVRGGDLARQVLAAWETSPSPALRTLLSRIARTFESRLFLVLRLRAGEVPRLEFLLFSDMSSRPDRVQVDVIEEKGVVEALTRMTYEAPVLRRTLPFRFAWTTLYDYPVIVQVRADRMGPGDRPKPGDLLLSVEGLQLDRPGVWEAVEAAIQMKEKVVIQFENPLQPKIRTVEVP
ncbi:MAG: PEGA domain-containing protein, partial [Acidobacteria bacterium]|nr:PEGA domain-containing protein [Acidobacteriota bacterium]MDW7985326.1 PEGA domain-containing protein [Acidobacteriota bacterium]